MRYVRDLDLLIDTNWNATCGDSFCFQDYAADMGLTRAQLAIELKPVALGVPASMLAALSTLAMRHVTARRSLSRHVKDRATATETMAENGTLDELQDVAAAKVKETEKLAKKELKGVEKTKKQRARAALTPLVVLLASPLPRS